MGELLCERQYSMPAFKMIMPKKLTLLFFGLFVISHAKGCSPLDIAERQGRFPYVVSVHDSGLNKSLCTGSIVSERHVITAARCVLTPDGAFKTQKFQVMAGTRDFNSMSIEHRVVADVVKMFVPAHPGKVDLNDIAILKLSEDFDFGKNPNSINKVGLPKKNRTYTGVEATAIGFGWINTENGTSDGKMRYAKVKLYEHGDCVMQLNEKFSISTARKQIYARVKRDGPAKVEDVCLGDSGGPLVHNHVLIGVANTSPVMCRDDEKPGVYARVIEFDKFIKSVLSGSAESVISS